MLTPKPLQKESSDIKQILKTLEAQDKEENREENGEEFEEA